MCNFIGDGCAGPDVGKLCKCSWLQFKHPVMYKIDRTPQYLQDLVKVSCHFHNFTILQQ